jgi:hypothetical protein
VLNGVFTIDAMDSLQNIDPAFREVCHAALDAYWQLEEEDQKRLFGIEIVDNRVVALHVKPA